MSNGLKNAGYLDRNVSGVPANWAAGSGAIVVDEDVIGGPGRAVLLVSGTAGTLTAHSDPIACSVGDVIEAAGGIAASAGTVSLSVEFLNVSNASVSVVPLPVLEKPNGQTVKRGLRNRFGWGFARIAAPSSAAKARLVITAAATGGGSHWGALLKPFLALLDGDATAERQPWDPGAHDNLDLNLPTWPTSCGRFNSGGQFKPVSNVSSYATDANIDTNSILYQDVEIDWTFEVRCKPDQHDDLEAFWAACMASDGSPIFYVVRPDTDALCFATWLKDGAPRPVDGRGPTLMVEGGLHLKVA